MALGPQDVWKEVDIAQFYSEFFGEGQGFAGLVITPVLGSVGFQEAYFHRCKIQASVLVPLLLL